MIEKIQISKSIVWVYDPKQKNGQEEPEPVIELPIIEEPEIDDDDTRPHIINPIIPKPANQMVLKSSRFSKIDWEVVGVVTVAVLTAVVQVLGVILGALASGIAEAASHSCLFSKWE